MRSRSASVRRSARERSQIRTHLEPIQSLPTRLIDVDSPNSSLRTGIMVVEPNRHVGVVDDHREGGNGAKVACAAEGRVEAVHRGVDKVRGDAGGGEEGLCRGVVALRDCICD